MTHVQQYPCYCEILEHLRQLQVVIRCRNGSLNLGTEIGRPSLERNMIQQRILDRAWELYGENLLDIPRFLACASHFLKAFDDENRITVEDQVDAYINVNMNGKFKFL